MADYNLAYPDVAIDAILNTAYYLQEAGYIFRGSASDYAGTPSKREWVIAPAGFSGYGISSPVPKGSIGICLYNGTSWVGKIINVLTLDSEPTRNSQNGVTSGGVAATLDAITRGIMETFASLLFDDETAAADLSTKLSYAVKFSVSDVYQTVTHLNILAATTSKAGLLSAADKVKIDSFLTNLRSLTFADTTASADQATQITETLKATIGGVQEVIDSITLLAATSSKAGLLSASDKAYIDALPAALTNLSNSISAALALMESLVGYYVCDTAAATAAKTVAATSYSLTNGGCIRIKMTNANTAANVTLNINSTGAKALYYDGAQASSTNTWEAGEVLEVYYDGTQYQCVSGGGGKFATGEKVKETSVTNTITPDSGALITSGAVAELGEEVDALDIDINGGPRIVYATWGDWRSSNTNPQRIFTICNKLAINGGTVRVSLTDYSTYKFGVAITTSTSWSTTLISDTGWKREDVTKVIASNEEGYYIRVSVCRVDNGAISPSDAAAIISLLQFGYMSDDWVGLINYTRDLYAKLGYYECSTAAATAAKSVMADGYILGNGGNIRIKMTNANTTDGVTLNINGTGAKQLYYNDEPSSSTNSWSNGEILVIYYDGTNYQCDAVGTLEKRIEELETIVTGGVEHTGTWGNLRRGNTNRIFVICDQTAVAGGVVKASISDYSTYNIGAAVQDGTEYNSPLKIDTGWQNNDIELLLPDSAEGYNIRVAFKRADNGTLTTEDVQSVLTLLSYKWGGPNSNDLVSRVDDIENDEVYKPQRIPMEVVNGARYVGSKIDLNEHIYTYTHIGNLSATSGIQGAAVFGKYLFQFYKTNNSVHVFNLESGQEVQVISMTANPNCHCNTASFGGQYYDANDDYPCVYVSSEGEGKVYVYRITGSEGAFVLTLVQTLFYTTSYYYPNLNVDAPNNRGVVVGYKENSWQVADNDNKMMCCCFDLPSVTDGDKTLTSPYNEFSFPFVYAAQGSLSRYGKLYCSFGNTGYSTRASGILVIDYLLKTVVSYIDVHAIGLFEPEGLGIYDGGFVLTVGTGGVYKIEP